MTFLCAFTDLYKEQRPGDGKQEWWNVGGGHLEYVCALEGIVVARPVVGSKLDEEASKATC